MELCSVSAFGAAGVASVGAVSTATPLDFALPGFRPLLPTLEGSTLSGEARSAVIPSTTSGLALGFVLAWDEILRDDWRRAGAGAGGGGGSAAPWR
jgi:hypothetical protein